MERRLRPLTYMPIYYTPKKHKKRGSEKDSKEQFLPPTPPESNPDVNLKTQPSTTGDESSSRRTLDSMIPPPVDFKGSNNPFLCISPVNCVPVVSHTKRKLTKKDIIITSNGEMRMRRVRKRNSKLQDKNARRINEIKPVPTTPTSSPIKSHSALSMEDDVKSTVNLNLSGVDRIASGEKFSVRAKRILPDGQTQYLINWDC